MKIDFCSLLSVFFSSIFVSFLVCEGLVTSSRNSAHFDLLITGSPLSFFLCLSGLVDKQSRGYDCPKEAEGGQEAEQASEGEKRTEALSDSSVVLTHLKVQLVERVLCSWYGSLVVGDTSVFEAAALIGPAVGRRFFIDLELHSDADTLQDVVLIADSTSFGSELHENAV